MKRTLLAICFVIATLQLLAQPVINKNPLSRTLCLDTCTELSVNAVGSGSAFYVYQWQADYGSGYADVNVPGIGQKTLSVCGSGQSAPQQVNHRCIVTDTNGLADTSAAAVISFDSCSLPIADFDAEYSTFTERCFTNTSKHASTIIWSFGDGSTEENVDTPCYDYPSQWYYTVTLHALNQYGSDKKTLELDLLAVEELKAGFRIYPNPVSDQLTVQTDLRVDAMKVIDIHGRTVAQSTAFSGEQQLDIAHLHTGVYTLVLTVDGTPMYRKITKK